MNKINDYLKIALITFFTTIVVWVAYPFLLKMLPDFLAWLISIIFVLFVLAVFVAGLVFIVIILVYLFRKKTIYPYIVLPPTVMLALLFSILILPSILPSILRPLPSGSDIRKFEPRTWKKGSSTLWNGGISEREKMLQDLVENMLPNKSKSEIIKLLGKPLDTEYFRSIDKDMIYYLGPERNPGGMAIDSEWLLIWLDDKGNFARYSLAND